MRNEDGIAYGWLVIVIFLIIGTAIYLAFTAVMAQTVPMVNKDIEAGRLSAQSRNAVNFNRGMIDGVPIFVILGITMFAVLRALYKRSGG